MLSRTNSVFTWFASIFESKRSSIWLPSTIFTFFKLIAAVAREGRSMTPIKVSAALNGNFQSILASFHGFRPGTPGDLLQLFDALDRTDDISQSNSELFVH